MTSFVRRRPLVSAVIAVIALLVLLEQLPDRPRDEAGGDRPLWQARADPQPLRAGPADRRRRSWPLVPPSVRRPDRMDRQARAGGGHGAAAGAFHRPAAADGRCLCALPDRRSAADVHPLDERGKSQEPAADDPPFRSPQRARPSSSSSRSFRRNGKGIMDDVRKLAEHPGSQVRSPDRATSGSRRPTFRTERRCSRRSKACARRVSRKRARSARRAQSRRRSSARRPTPTLRRPMRRASARTREFYDFYRAMQSYLTTFVGDGQEKPAPTNIILSPQNDYLKEFTGRTK